MKADNLRFVSVLLAVLMLLSFVFVSCGTQQTEDDIKEDKTENASPDDGTDEVPYGDDQPTDDGAEEAPDEDEPSVVEGVLDVTKLPLLPEEVHTCVFSVITYLTPDGKVAGGGSTDDEPSISMRLPAGVTCFPYNGDGDSPDWGLMLYKVATTDDFAEDGYYITENTVDDRFTGFGDKVAVSSYTLPNGTGIMEEKVLYFDGGVGYNFYVRVDGEHIVRMSVAEANESDADLYRAVIASFVFSGADE